jgi:hypothetical protein
MTSACHWQPPSEAAGSPPDIKPCVSGKLGFASADELRWHLNRGRWPKAATSIYRCHCGQYHSTSQPPTERKRLVKATRRRLGLTGSSEAST